MDKNALAERLKTISQQATRGNVDSIIELMSIATDLYEEEDFKFAAETFKDAAICYRIEALSRRTRWSEVHAVSPKEERLIANLSDWIERSEEFKSSIRTGRGLEIDRETIRLLLFEDIFVDPDHEDLVWDLGEAIERTGYQFSSPGDSVRRVIWNLVQAGLGSDNPSYQYPMLQNPAVGIAFSELMQLVISKLPEQKT